MRYQTKDLLLAAAFGWLSGHRSMSGPAIVGSRLLKNRNASRLLAAGAVGEILVDKHPETPNRNDPEPLIARTLAGAMTGAAIGVSGSGRLKRSAWLYGRHIRRYGGQRRDIVAAGLTGAVVGGIAAFAGTHASYRLRRWVTERTDAPGAALGAAEDAIVYGVGIVLGEQVRIQPM